MNFEDPDEDTIQRWHKDPNNWKWGFFYFNSKDKRIFVLKRNKFMGITLNYAHSEAHLFTAMIFGGIVLLALFAK